MSLAASVGRDMMLTARNSDLIFQINLLTEQLMQFANASSRLNMLTANLMPGTPESRQFDARLAAIKDLSKAVEMQLELLRAQQRAVQTELESVRKAISEDIQRSFKTFAN